MLKLIGIILFVIDIIYFVKSILFLNLKSFGISAIILFSDFIYWTMTFRRDIVIVDELYNKESITMVPVEKTVIFMLLRILWIIDTDIKQIIL